MDRGTSTLIAGAAGALVLPALVFGLTLPLWLSFVVAIGVFAGLMLALRSSGRGLDVDALEAAQGDTVRELVNDGAAALARVKRIAPSIKDPAMKSAVLALTATSDKILARVQNDQSRAMAVRRFLTFYLPNAASIAEGWQTLESSTGSSPERKDQAREVMKSLDEAALKYATDAEAPELNELDLSLKVVKDALKSDLEKTA